VENHSNFIELKKHINTIHCSNNLTLIQRKLFNALLFNAYPELPHKQKFQIKIKDLSLLIGYNSKDTVTLKNALLGLITTAIEWNIIDDKSGQEKKWNASSILASAELTSGFCFYEYSQVMKDFLYKPEIYGRIDIKLVSRFKSSYGLALYENCIRYQGLQQTPWFSLEIFRKLMGVFEDKYLAFRDFKKRVLDTAINEVNTISPLFISPEVERMNKKPIKIRFKLEKKINDLISIDPIIEQDLSNVLINTFGFSEKLLKKITSSYEISYIREKIDFILQSPSFSSGKIKGMTGYLIESLKNDYKQNKASAEVLAEYRKRKELEEKKNKNQENEILKHYNQYVTKKINDFTASLSLIQHEQLISDYEKSLEDQAGILKGLYKKHGFEHPVVKGSLNNFIRESKGSQVGEILSFEKFSIQENKSTNK